MLLHDYTSMDVFNKNFFKDWRKVMTPKERELITDLGKCNFQKMHAYFTDQSEKRKARSKEEKQVLVHLYRLAITISLKMVLFFYIILLHICL